MGIFGAEPWTNAMREDIEEKWGIDAVDIYGLSEIIGPGVAFECVEAKNGMHINEDHFIVETINLRQGRLSPTVKRASLFSPPSPKRLSRLSDTEQGTLPALSQSLHMRAFFCPYEQSYGQKRRYAYN